MNEINIILIYQRQQMLPGKAKWDDSVAANAHQFTAKNGPNQNLYLQMDIKKSFMIQLVRKL